MFKKTINCKGFKINNDSKDRFTGANTTKRIIDKYPKEIKEVFSKTKKIYFTNIGMNFNIYQNDGALINLDYNENGSIIILSIEK